MNSVAVLGLCDRLGNDHFLGSLFVLALLNFFCFSSDHALRFLAFGAAFLDQAVSVPKEGRDQRQDQGATLKPLVCDQG